MLAAVLTVMLCGTAFAQESGQEPADAESSEPAAPSQEQPAASSQEQPVAPSQEQPAAPAQEQPAAPSQEQPAAPAQEQPAAPAQEQPAAPLQEQSAVSAQTLADAAFNNDPPIQTQSALLDSFRAAPLRTLTLNSTGGSFGEDGGKSDPPANQTEPLLVIGNQSINFEKDTSDATDDTAATWTYSSSDGSITLTGYNGTDQLIGTAGRDLTIKASGVNRIGSLVVDGNINIVGSGIILVDSIQFPSDKSFSFSSNTTVYPEGYGSAAVFLKQTEIVTDGQGNETEKVWYELVNGDVTGLLDESCTLPEGVTLVMPNGSQVVLQSVAKVTDHKTETVDGHTDSSKETYYSTEEVQDYKTNDNTAYFGSNVSHYYSVSAVAPQLTIPVGSGLIVDSGAVMRFNQIEVITNWFTMAGIQKQENIYDTTYIPSIALKGLLEVQGRLENAFIRIAEGGSLDGREKCLNSSIIDNDNAQNSEISSSTVTTGPDNSTAHAGGDSQTTTTTVQTGSGNLGQNAGSITGGLGLTGLLSGRGIRNPVTAPTQPGTPPQGDPINPPQTDPVVPPQTDPITPPEEKPDTPAEDSITSPKVTTGDHIETNDGEDEAEETISVRVAENRVEKVFSLIVETSEGTQLHTLETKIKVTMKYSIPASKRGKTLYVVFRNTDKTLEIIKAVYDSDTGELIFETDRTGKFVVVAFDFDGDETFPGFYDALALLDEVKNLK